MERPLHSPHSFKRQIEVLSELREAFLFSAQYPSMARWNRPQGVRFFPQTIHQAAPSLCTSLPFLAFLVYDQLSMREYK